MSGVMTPAAGAAWARGQGFRVFGLRAGDKRPLPGGRGYLDAFATGIEVDWHWHNNPAHNVGIVTGLASGIIVLDVEPGERDPDGVVETLTVSTARGGVHYYYKAVTPIKRRIKPIPGCDVLGDGGYVVGPGSSIVGAGSYQIINDVPMTRCPVWLAKLEVVRASEQRQFASSVYRARVPSEVSHIAAGGRNSAFASLAGVCIKRGLTVDEALDWCLEVERTRCDRSGDWGGSNEVERVVRGVYRRYG